MNIKSFSIPLFFSIVFLFASCAKLPVYQSKTYAQAENNDFLNPLSANFDKKNNISYGVANDDTHFYIQVIFQNRESLMKIMRGGLTVYFDPSGKKKKDYQLKIEKAEVQLSEYELMNRQENRKLNNPQQNMPATIDAMYNKVTWDKNGDKFVFYRNLQQEPIAVSLGPNKQNQLMLEIKMPLSELALTDGQNHFSVGIETRSLSTGNMGGGRPSGGMRPSGGGGMGGRGGGGMGGRGGRSGGGMHSGGGSRPSGGSSSGMEPISIWFKVQL